MFNFDPTQLAKAGIVSFLALLLAMMFAGSIKTFGGVIGLTALTVAVFTVASLFVPMFAVAVSMLVGLTVVSIFSGFAGFLAFVVMPVAIALVIEALALYVLKI